MNLRDQGKAQQEGQGEQSPAGGDRRCRLCQQWHQGVWLNTHPRGAPCVPGEILG